MEFRAFAAQELSALAHKLVDAAQQQTDAATSRLAASFETTIERLRMDHEQVVADNDRLTAENTALTWERDELATRRNENQRQSLIAGLCAAFDSIALGSSVDDVAIAAARGLMGEFSRVAALTIHDNRIELCHADGFDVSGTNASLVSDAAQSFLAEALRFDGLRQWCPDALGTGAPFGGAPSAMVTVPLLVRGEIIALVYADDAGQDNPAERIEESLKVVGMLRRHAMLALEQLTIELKATAELRAYARMLLDEVEYVYDADMASKTGASERQARVRENVRCARHIYGQRVSVEGPAAAALLNDLIARTISDKASTPFGQDLAAATIAPADSSAA